MAENKDDQDNDENQEAAAEKAPMSGKKKLIILIVIGLLVIAGSIGGTLWLLGVFDGGDEGDMAAAETAAEVTDKPAVNKPKPAIYFPIKPAFVVNFPSQGRQRFLQVDITVMTRDPDIFTALQNNLPLVKNRLVMLLSGQVYKELQTDEGKEMLRQKALEALQELMQQEVGKKDVEQVLFTNFVMQ